MTSVTEAPPLLQVRHLVKRFPIPHSDKVVHACEDVTFDVAAGETVGIIGESGSGKTTLGRCILRLIEPTSGEVRLDGRDIAQLSPREVRRLRADVQIVFQEPYDSLNPQLPIGYQITEPLRIHRGIKRGQRRAEAERLLGLVGLPPSAAQVYPGALPMGALQRCSIARALATEPRLVVLDEPTSALAPESESEVIALLQDLQQRLGLAYIFISHDLSLIGRVCDRVAVMYLSEVVELGPSDTLFADPQHPYSRALLDAVLLPDPRRRREVRTDVEQLAGEVPSPIDLPTGCHLAGRCPHVLPRCREERQELRERVAGHPVRCWRAVEEPEAITPGAATDHVPVIASVPSSGE